MTEASSSDPIVIVGAGLAGSGAAETLRAEGYAGPLVLIGEEPFPPYDRPPLSKGYLTGSDPRDGVFLHDADWYAGQDVELRLGSRVTMLDAAAHIVTVDGHEPLRYRSLLLATGSRVVHLPVPGAGLAGVRTLRTLSDSDELLAAFQKGGRVVVVGGGWIGLETAAAARGHGAEVTLVEQDPTPLYRVVGGEVGRAVGEAFAELHRENGVDLRLGVGVAEIIGADGHVTGVRLTDGGEVPADLVVVGIGVRPAVELAETAGLTVDDGVVCDELHRTSAPDVFAVGDVSASHRPWLGRRLRVEHWSNALDGGPAAARHMLGGTDPYDQVPFFFSDQYDLGLEYSGYVGPDGADAVVFRGDVPGREFIAFWLRDGRVLAGMNVNVWDVTEQIEALVRSGARVDTGRLADPSVPLPDLHS